MSADSHDPPPGDPKEGAEPNAPAGELAAPNRGELVAPNAGVLPAPKAGVLAAAPKAGVLLPNGEDAPNAGVLGAPNAGDEDPPNALVAPKAGCMRRGAHVIMTLLIIASVMWLRVVPRLCCIASNAPVRRHQTSWGWMRLQSPQILLLAWPAPNEPVLSQSCLCLPLLPACGWVISWAHPKSVAASERWRGS